MAASAEQLAITLCLIGLMVGSACATSEMLDTEEQEFVHGSNRRLLLPCMYNIYHPAPSPPPAPALYAPSPAAAPAPPTANYAEPASPAPQESNVAPPAPPSSITPFQEPNRVDRWPIPVKIMIVYTPGQNETAPEFEMYHDRYKLQLERHIPKLKALSWV